MSACHVCLSGGRIKACVLQESLIDAYRGRPLPFGQLQIEIHVWGNMTVFSKFLGWWEMLEEAGLRPFWTEVESLIIANPLGR